MGLKLKNDAVSRIASGISSTDTTITLVPGSGTLFPVLSSGDYFPATLIKSDGSREIIRVTARSSDVFTVVRAQEGTVALTFNANDKIELRLTAGTLTDPSGPSAASITSASAKAEPEDADLFGYTDSADAFKLKKISFASLKAALKTSVLGFVYPVGSIYTNAASTENPSTLLGFGAWEEIGQGRVLIGQNINDGIFDALGETGGSKDSVVVAHSHSGNTGGQSNDHAHYFVTNAAGNHAHNYTQNYDGGGWASGGGARDNQTTGTTSYNGNHQHDGWTNGVNSNHSHGFNTDSAGQSGANANLPPYLVVKMWKRVS